jgi:DNA-directed RNA polymerase specialized sigma24 family protein
MSDGPGLFEKVYDAHVLGVYRFIYARVGNHPDAEDLTAQVFTRAVERASTWRTASSSCGRRRPEPRSPAQNTISNR